MARRHSTSPIPAFPSDIDRRDFGNWLSGFVDGEGTFILYFYRGCAKATFAICLRADDKPILDQIRSFLGCGSPVYTAPVYDRKLQRGNESQTSRYAVTSISSLTSIIVPFFEAYPLRAKKRRDFLIWKEAVDFIYKINLIKTISFGCKGFAGRWTEARKSEFQTFISALKLQRAFDSPVVEAPVSEKPYPLFESPPQREQDNFKHALS